MTSELAFSPAWKMSLYWKCWSPTGTVGLVESREWHYCQSVSVRVC